MLVTATNISKLKVSLLAVSVAAATTLDYVKIIPFNCVFIYFSLQAKAELHFLAFGSIRHE